MKIKLLTCIFLHVAILFVCAVNTYATDFTYNGLKYTTITESSCYVSGYSTVNGDVTIPETVYSDNTAFTVTSIGEKAFIHCAGLTSLTIPSSVTSIAEDAFFWCTDLTSLTIPNSMTEIGDYAFAWCSNLTELTIVDGGTEIEIGNGVFYDTPIETAYLGRNISKSIFSGHTNLSNITIGNNVTELCDKAFYECSGLTSLSIPSSVTSIGDYALSGCSGLTSLSIPSSVISIGDYTCYKSDNLVELTIEDGYTEIGIGNNAFYNVPIAKVYLGRNISSRIFSGKADLTDVAIGNKVTEICANAFYECSGLTSLSIPSSVTSIGSNAFAGCSKLTELTIEDGGTEIEIGNYAFYKAPIETAYLGRNVSKSIFSGNTNLSNIKIGDNVTKIIDQAFYGCSGLTSLSIPNSVTLIGDYAFWNCSGLSSLTIPYSVTSIGDKAYGNCSSVERLTIEDGETEIIVGDNAFYNVYPTSVYLGRDISETIFCGITNLADVTIGDKVTAIRANAFSGCSGLTSLSISNSVTSIGSNAFTDCSGLTSLSIPSSVTSIGSNAFQGCSGLTSLSIPNSVTLIGNNVFQGCSGLTSLSIPSSIASIGSKAFQGCSGLTTLSIPSSVTSIGNYAFADCVGIGNLTIEDCEKMMTVGDNAFDKVNPKTAYLGRNISTTIFSGNANLTGLTIGSKVTTICVNAFQNCSGLTSLNLPSSVIWIRDSAFEGCSGLTSLFIPSSVTMIASSAFKGCSSLTSLTIPGSVTMIGNYTLSGCSSLNSLSLPSSITSIGDYAFSDCASLSSLSIPSSVTSIGYAAFRGCSGLTSFSIPNLVTSIGDYAFSDCISLKWIESQSSTPPTIQRHTFTDYSVPLLAASENYKTADYWKNFASIAASYVPTGITFEADGLYYEIISINDLSCRLYAIDESITGENVVIPETVEYKNRSFAPIEINGVLIKGNSSVKTVSIPSCAVTISEGIIFNSSIEKLSINAPITSNLLYSSSVVELVISPSTTRFDSDLSSNSICNITIEDCESELITNQIKCNATEKVYLGRNVSSYAFADMTSLDEVEFSEKVTLIDSNQFSGCTGLTWLSIPSSVDEIKNYAFKGCTGVSKLIFEDGVDSVKIYPGTFDCAVPKEAYFGRQMNFASVPCGALETVEFGEDVISIDNGAFKDGSIIHTVISHNTIAPETDDTFSNETYLYGVLYVPEASIKEYQEATGWKNFWDVKPLDDSNGVDNIEVDDEPESIIVRDGAICVCGNGFVKIVAINGVTVYSGYGDARVNVAPGVYIVTLGNKAHKIVIR